ncbi:MAG: hypothetical protein AAF108_09185 [Planctomycetota bacterium]
MCERQAVRTTAARAASGPRRTPMRRGSTLVLVLGSLALIAVLTVVYVSVGRADRRTAVASVERRDQVSSIDTLLEAAVAPIADDMSSTRIESAAFNANNLNGPSVARFVFEDNDVPSTSPGAISVFPVTGNAVQNAGEFGDLRRRHGFSPEGSIELSWWNVNQNSGVSTEAFGLRNLLLAIDIATPPTATSRLLADYRTPSDPFLASTLPTDVDGDAVALADDANAVFEDRDWRHISNISPDGRFVNLYNLRSDANYQNAIGPWNAALSGRVGGFDAPSGFSVDNGLGFSHDNNQGLTQGADPRLGISDGLFWYQDRTGAAGSTQAAINSPYIPSTAYQLPTANGVNTAINSATLFDIAATAPALQTLPYLFDTNQRELFRPATDLPNDIDRGLWADPYYWRYHFADADGDGMLDARWQEMVDASNPRAPVSLVPGSDLRLFVAARVVDLSALVNVNTATDDYPRPFFDSDSDSTFDPPEPFADINGDGLIDTTAEFIDFGAAVIGYDPLVRDVPNDAGARIGASPAEVSLRRILTMEDVFQDTRATPLFGLNFGDYRSFAQPIDLDPDAAGAPGDYDGFAALSPGLGSLSSAGPQFLSGRGSVFAIRRTLEGVAPPPITTDNTEFSVVFGPLANGQGNPARLSSGGRFTNLASTYEGAVTQLGSNARRDVTDRASDYNRLGGAYTSEGLANSTADGSTLFGVDDLAELLTFWGANDDRVTTRLEAATSGRANPVQGVNVVNNSLFAVGPLRSDRPTELELARGDISFTDPGNYSPPEAARDLLFSVFNSRRYLTTVSGATPRVGRRVVAQGERVIASQARYQAVDTRRLLHSGADRIVNPGGTVSEAGLVRNAFGLYAEALLPYAAETLDNDGDGFFATPAGINADDNPWWDYANAPGRQANVSPEKLTEAYGHEGTELPLRLAAHMAVNFRDMVDANALPTAATLVLRTNPDPVATGLAQPPELAAIPLGTTVLNPEDANGDGFSELQVDNTGAVVFDGNGFPIAANPVFAGRPLGAVADRIDVFGVEPQPFITEAVTYSAYADTPEGAAGGDRDWADTPVAGTTPTPDDFRGVVTVDSLVDQTNPDFLFQVFAVQLSNPFSTPVSLNNCYIEFGNQVFLVPDLTIINPHSSRWLYTTNPTEINGTSNPVDPITVEGRVNNALGFDPASGGDESFVFINYLNAQLGVPPIGLDNADHVPLVRLADPNDISQPWHVFDETRFVPESPTKAPGINFGGNPFDGLGSGATNPAFADLFDEVSRVPVGQQGFGEHSMVLLWRDINPANPLIGDDLLTNDLLLDRLTDPRYDPNLQDRRPTLDTRPIFSPDIVDSQGRAFISDGLVLNGFVKGTPTNGSTGIFTQAADPDLEPGLELPFAPGTGFDRVAGDQVVFSFVFARSIRRPNDIDDVNGNGLADDRPIGAMPPWAFEVKRSAESVVAPLNVTSDLAGLSFGGLVLANAEPDGANLTIFGATPDALDLGFGEAQALVGGQQGWVGTSLFQGTPSFLGSFQPAGDRAILPTTRLEADQKRSTDLAVFALSGNLGVDRYNDRVFDAGGNAFARPNYQARYLEVHNLFSGNFEFAEGLRVGDTLLPMAVGPFRRNSGFVATDTAPNQQRPRRLRNDFTTLAESLAIAYGYGVHTTPDAVNPNPAEIRVTAENRDFAFQSLGGLGIDTANGPSAPTPAMGYSFETVRQDAQVGFRNALDNGRLRLDAYQLFTDGTDNPNVFGFGKDGLFNPDFESGGIDLIAPNEINPITGRLYDELRGFGIPAALNVFALASAGGELSDDRYGDLTRPMMGLVNINTAPKAVLRSLPLVAPALQVQNNVGSPRGPLQDWGVVWRTPNGPGSGFQVTDHLISPFFSAPGLQVRSNVSTGIATDLRDVSASIFSYATGLDTFTRRNRSVNQGVQPLAGTLAQAPLTAIPVALADRDPFRPSGADNRLTADPLLTVPQFVSTRRNSLFGLRARTDPGFASLGELSGAAPQSIGASTTTNGRPAVAVDQVHAGFGALARDVYVDVLSPAGPDNIGGGVGISLGSIPARDSFANAVNAAGNPLTVFAPGSPVGVDPFLYLIDRDNDTVPDDLDAPGTGFGLADVTAIAADDGIANDYDEQLVELNAIANAASVRSDFYAMWLVVQGFRPQDVEGLEPSDPLVPTLRERYLLVVDRSNVRQKGDRPRILLKRRLDAGPLN